MRNVSVGRTGCPMHRGRLLPSLILTMAAAVCGAVPAQAAITVTLEASPAILAPVGTMVRWTGQVFGGSGDVWYRFRVRERGGAFRMIRDFGPVGTLDWTSLAEGVCDVELTVRDRGTAGGRDDRFAVPVRAADRRRRPSSVRPLIRWCSSSAVRLPGRAGRGSVSSRPAGCRAVHAVPALRGRPHPEFLSRGPRRPTRRTRRTSSRRQLRPDSAGPAVAFATGDVAFRVLARRPPAGGRAGFGRDPAAGPALRSAVCDRPRRQPRLDGAGRPLIPDAAGGGRNLLRVAESRTDPARNVLRKFDLVGMTVLETNAARVSEQLVAMGKRPITGFHHEARSIQGGRIAVLASVEQIFTDVQGPGPVDVLGDMIVVLDAGPAGRVGLGLVRSPRRVAQGGCSEKNARGFPAAPPSIRRPMRTTGRTATRLRRRPTEGSSFRSGTRTGS